MVGGDEDEDEGHVAPTAAPAVFVPPVLVHTPPHSFVLPHARSHSPVLICNPALICTLLCSVVFPHA